MKRPKFYLVNVFAKDGQRSRGNYQGKKLVAEPQVIELSCFPERGKTHVRWSTQMKIRPDFWDFDDKFGRAKVIATNPRARKLNAYLDRCSDLAEEIVEDAALDFRTLSRDEFRQAMDEAVGRKPKAAKIELIEFIERSRYKELPEDKPKGWLEKYHPQASQLKTHLQNYMLEYRIGSIRFSDVTQKMYNDFRQYMSDAGLKVNTQGKHIGTLYTLMNNAKKRGLHTNLAFESFEKISEEVDSLALYVEEVMQIYESEMLVDLNDEPLTEEQRIEAEQCKDWYCLDCFVGLRFGDLEEIDEDNFSFHGDVRILTAYTSKGNKTVGIPCHWLVEEIVNKYEKLPPIPGNAKYNKILKVIGYNAKLSKPVVFNGVRYKMWEKLTAHTARRTLAVNFEEAGIPRNVTMAITGHVKESDFLRYIKRAIRSRRAVKILKTYSDFFTKQ